MALLDEEGLDRLSLRHLGERLGVRAPTLYWHIRDKRHLLDLIAAEMFRETFERYRLPTAAQDWGEWLAERARSLRASLLAHRDSARVLAGNRPPPAALVEIEAAVGGLVDVGFAPAEALLALLSLAAFVMGEVLDEQAETARDARSTVPEADRLGAGTSPWPLLGAAAQAVFADDDARFEFGVQALVNGLRARLAPLPGLRPNTRLPRKD